MRGLERDSRHSQLSNFSFVPALLVKRKAFQCMLRSSKSAKCIQRYISQLETDSVLAFRERKDVNSEDAHQRLLGAWQSPDPAKRPSVSLFVYFVLSLMAHADAALLQRLLSVRLAVSCKNASLTRAWPGNLSAARQAA